MAAATDADTFLPNAVIIGAAKCGTTSLHRYLGTHPEIFVTKQKEIHFFISGASWTTWERGIDWYRRHFRRAHGCRIRLESSPGYSFDEYAVDAARRMSEIVPHARLIYMIRDPLQRVVSHYWEAVYGGGLTPEITLSQIIRAGPRADGPEGHFYRRFVYASMYMRQLEKFLGHFPCEQIHLVVTERLAADPVAMLRGLFRYLNVDEQFKISTEMPYLNQRSEKRLRTRDPIALVRRLPGYTILSKLVPERSKEKYRRIIGEKLDDTRLAHLDAHDLDHLRDVLSPDMQRLRSETGLALSDWSV